jgi:hypothetical protein
MSVMKPAVKVAIKQYETLFSRHPGNPILTGKDWPYSINSVFNAGAAMLADGSTLLLCRVEDRRGLSHLCAARSVNGVDDWQIDREPTLLPNPEQFPEEVWGIEDPRITYVPELKKFAVAYTSYSRGGPGVSLALGKPQAHAGSPPGRLVGCQQDWHVPSSHRNVQRLAHDLSRRSQDSFELHLPAGPGSLRSSRAG